jgi:hypothetical protein
MATKSSKKLIQYTLRGISPATDARLRALAARQQKSLNKVLREAVEEKTTKQSKKTPAEKLHHDFDNLFGKWVDDPGFDEAIKDMRVVDPRDWQ